MGIEDLRSDMCCGNGLFTVCLGYMRKKDALKHVTVLCPAFGDGGPDIFLNS